jgi:hypothetical protein
MVLFSKELMIQIAEQGNIQDISVMPEKIKAYLFTYMISTLPGI